jgi:hypothetical protein
MRGLLLLGVDSFQSPFCFRMINLTARMVELVDTRDLKSRGLGRVRAGSSPAPGTKINC